MRFLRALALTVGALAAFAAAADAQTAAGGVNGAVSDPNGASVPGATFVF